MKSNIKDLTLHKNFLKADRPHILMITNHGIHEWQITAGLPDTGGQNIFVNQFTDELINKGFKVSIANRGGFPHPIHGNLQEGIDYKNDFQRILYLKDGSESFIRKEDMLGQIPDLAQCLSDHFSQEQTKIDLIISHYWDAAILAIEFLEKSPEKCRHIWVPHSLGLIKKKNVLPEKWGALKIDERIQHEKRIIQNADGIAATSSLVKTTLEEMGYSKPILWLPPCINTERFHPAEVTRDDPVWQFLSDTAQLPVDKIRTAKIISEISRTDTTKRKDILIKAFAEILTQHPDAFLIISINKEKEKVANPLFRLVKDLGIEKNIAVIGSAWEFIPRIYQISDVYCSPSIMEGFGMSVQEAAASKTPVISSHLVPFATEFLLGENKQQQLGETSGSFKPIFGDGAVIVKADDIPGFAQALQLLLDDDTLREQMGLSAYQTTIPHFTWEQVVSKFLEEIHYST